MEMKNETGPAAKGIRNYFSDRAKRRKFIRWILIGIAAFIVLAFLFRSVIVTYYVRSRISHFNEAFHAELTVDKIRVKSLSSVFVSGIALKPDRGDTLLKIDTVYVRFSFWRLLTGTIRLGAFTISNIDVSLVRKDSTDNYTFLFDRGKKTAEDTGRHEVNYASRARILSEAIFDRIPESMQVDNFTLSMNTKGHLVSVHFDRFAVKDHLFRNTMILDENGEKTTWVSEGSIDNSDHSMLFSLYPEGGKRGFIPYLKYRYNAEIGFDTLSFRVEEKESSADLTTISGYAGLSGLEVNHEKIAVRDVLFEKLAIGYTVNFGPDYMEVDSATLVTFNRLTFHPYVRYRPDPSKQITLKIHKPEFPAEELFSSIPEGLFTNFNGVHVKGDLSYDLDFFVDLAIPDSLKFSTELKRQHFSVTSYGDLNLTRINEPFLYTAYERGQPVRSFMVGPENPNFRPIGKISPYLQVSILNSEDGGFYQHRGFIEDSFRESIITNIKEHKFVRGGSTITMQLVKNVFLQRNKTIGRKLEEVLLVWLIENQGLSSKDRMYEVYLNIIEWGPMVYGANEASRFYFSKDASKLTLAEAIFLSSIIPKPKWFAWSFDENGHLKENQAGFYKLLSGKMLKKGQITQEDWDRLIPDVELKGPAKLLLKKAALMPADSINKGEVPEDDIWN
jgi:hypothetical protein